MSRDWLKEKRLAKGLSQAKVAKLADIHLQTYIHIERFSDVDPRLSTARAISEVLDFGIEEWILHEA